MATTGVTNNNTPSLSIPGNPPASESNTQANPFAVGDGETKSELVAEKQISTHIFEQFDSDETGMRGVDSNDGDLTLQTSSKNTATPPQYGPREGYIQGWITGYTFANAFLSQSKDFDASQMLVPKYDEKLDENNSLTNLKLGFEAAIREVLRVSIKESDRTLDSITSLFAQINAKTDQLNRDLANLANETITPQSGEAGKLNESAETMGAQFNYFKNRMMGGFQAIISTTGQLAVATIIPTASSYLPVSFGVKAFSGLAGAYLGMDALNNFPSLANDHAALKTVNDFQKKVDPLFQKLNQLISQEKLRQTLSERIALTSHERDARVDAIQQDLDNLGNQIDKVIGEKTPSLEEFLGDTEPDAGSDGSPVTPGDVKEGTQPPPGPNFIRRGFAAVFSSIFEAFSRLSSLLSELPLISSRDTSRDVNEENEFRKAFKTPLNALARASEYSAYNTDSHVRALVKEGVDPKNMGEVRKEQKREFHIGENLTETIKSSNSGAFGVVVVTDELSRDPKNKDSVADQYAVPASLTLARSMGTYFSMLAPSPGDASKNGVMRNPDGSLSIDDPEGKLYNFLLAVPSAYTATMVGSSRREAHARLTIDDPTRSFPGGASSMQVEVALKHGEDGKPLRDSNGNFITELKVSFLTEQARPVFTPLANESRVLNDVHTQSRAEALKAEEAEAIGKTQPGAIDYTGWDLSRLLQRQDELIAQLEQETALLQIDQNRFMNLQYWEHPEAQKYRQP